MNAPGPVHENTGVEDCLFCGIVAGTIPARTVAETDLALAFMDINPASDGHLLVIPKRHSKDLLEIDEEDLAACSALSKQMAARMVDRLDADGVNLLNCCGADAWQSVFHFHFHVLPRFRDQPDKDRLRLPWTPTPGDEATIAAVAEKLAD